MRIRWETGQFSVFYPKEQRRSAHLYLKSVYSIKVPRPSLYRNVENADVGQWQCQHCVHG
jgi:phosphatidylethanolamine-binding protein (PEBP) family uncharacterized protein